MKCPQIIHADLLLKDWPESLVITSIKDIYGTNNIISNWYLARPLSINSIFTRFKLSFLVFIGKYDALKLNE